MGWTNELYDVYELVSQNPENGVLPVSHSTANAQIELTIDVNGDFKAARTVEKEEAKTIIPVTEDSGARSSGISPMPFADKLLFIAGDYPKYANGKRTDNEEYYKKYMEQLKGWRQSKDAHPAVIAVYRYLEKRTVMEDLIRSGVLKLAEQSGRLLSDYKINSIAQEDAFVRFVIQYSELGHEPNTWLDKSLYNSFIDYNSEQMGMKRLCYATGREDVAVTYKHPSKIRNSGDKAKLISSNDTEGFSYRGRFKNKEEALSVSYVFSQKMHNALKWLIEKQGQSFGSLTVVTWASALKPLPNVLDQFCPSEDDWEEEESYQSLPAYKTWLSQYIFGYRQSLQNDSKVMLLGLDAASTGRLSIALYEELASSEFLNNIESWHEKSAWLRYDFNRKKELVRSFGLYEIIKAAYGFEQGGRLECDEKVCREQVLRLMPCVTSGKPIPEDLIQSLYHKASNPLSYEKYYNHRTVIETACGMIRVKKKGVTSMGYDPRETDRSYLYGCLLAIADKAESDTYDETDRGKRETNARRYWANFSQRPYQTWQNIEERLRPYIDRHPYRVQIEKWIEEITDRFSPATFRDNRRLDPIYLLGYHHFTMYMFSATKNRKEEE